MKSWHLLLVLLLLASGVRGPTAPRFTRFCLVVLENTNC